MTASPGFISIAVQDVDRSATFYERCLGAMRDTFDFGPDSAVFVGWPTFALSSERRPDLPGPSPETTSIQLWWRASNAQALFEQVAADGVTILAEPFDGPFGRTFAMADPDGYRITVYEKDQPLVLAAPARLRPAGTVLPPRSPFQILTPPESSIVIALGDL